MNSMQVPTEIQKINDNLKLIPIRNSDEFLVEIDGVQVPRLTVTNGTMGRYNIHLDGRFDAAINGKSLYPVLNLIANALAISGGFSYMRASSNNYESRNSNS